VKDPEFIIQRCNSFLRDVAKPLFDDMTDETFKTAVNAVLISKKEVDVALSRKFARLFREIESHRYLFDRKE
jgi:secreted Zn-dependent insulinase-like peptidase